MPQALCGVCKLYLHALWLYDMFYSPFLSSVSLMGLPRWLSG